MEQCKMTREEICEYLVKSRTEHECVHFKDVVFENLDLRDFAFMDCSFTNCKFIRCDLAESNFTASIFSMSAFIFCDLERTNFYRCHFVNFFFEFCYIGDAIFLYSNFNGGGFNDCKIIKSDMTNTYLSDVSVTRGILSEATFEYSTFIDLAVYNTVLEEVSFSGVDNHHIVMDEVTLHDTDLDPLGDEVTVYGGFEPIEPVEDKEIAVHLLVNTKGEATVTLVEEV